MSKKHLLKKEEADKLPHLRTDQLHGRCLLLLPLWDGEKWKMWITRPDGTILPIPVNDAVHSDYLAQNAARSDDIYLPFIDFMMQRASWPDVEHWFRAIRDDLHNLGTALAKIDFFFDHRDDIDGVTRFVATEVEYIFTVCRSAFDLLQETIKRLWADHTHFLDEALRAAKKQLKKSFSQMVLAGNEPCSAQQIQERFGLLPELAEFYAGAAPFFLQLRDHRDGVIHGGATHEVIFDTERGFAVEDSLEPFASWGVWRNTEPFNKNGLVSLRPALAHLVYQTFRTCNAFTDAMARTIKFPPEIAPGLRLFIRGQHNAALLKAGEILDSGEHWWA